jgi:predicted permease
VCIIGSMARAWLADFVQDLSHGARVLLRSPLSTSVSILTVAIAIGASTAIFSLLHALVLRDLPVRDPASLVQFRWQYPGDPPLNMFGVAQYKKFRDESTVFSDVMGLAPFRLALNSPAGPETRNVACVTGNFFTALGVGSAAGRLLGAWDDAPSSEAVAVMSWSYWRDRFNLDPNAIGNSISVVDIPLTIVGVASRDFTGPIVGYQTEIWLPTTVCERKAPVALALLARLKHDVTLDRATSEARSLDQPRIEGFAAKDPQWRRVILNLSSARTGLSTPLHDQFGQPLWVLMAVGAVLLLLAGANLGGMFLARGTARHREMAVRVSLGAGRSRIVRQLLTESLLVATAGGLLGLLGAYFGARLLLRIMSSGTRMIGAPPEIAVAFDANVFLFTVASTVLTALLFGLAPAWTTFVHAPASSLRDGATAGLPRRRRFVGDGLVVAQVALSLALVAVAHLYVQHLAHLRGYALGFDASSVLLVSVDTGPSGLSRPQLNPVFKELLRRFETIPGVQSATISGTTPISGGAASRFVTVEGVAEPLESRQRVALNGVGPRYFETYRTPVVAGREFEFSDEPGARVAIVNQAMTRHYFPDGQVLGKRLRFDKDPQPYEIVGVVGDAKYTDVRGPAPRTVYVHHFQSGMGGDFSLRTRIASPTVAADVRRVVDEVLKGATVRKVTTLSEQVDAAIVPERLIAGLSGFFGATAALLAAIGLYGLLAFTVARRTREFGVRVALGATPRDIISLVLRYAVVLVLVGLLLGAPLALSSTRLAASMVVNLSAQGLAPMVSACAAIIAVALLAAYIPARRATRVDPLVALRSE